MARIKVDNKLNVVVGTKAQILDDTTIPDNSIVIVTDEELAPSNAEQNVQSDWNQTVNTEDDFIKNKPTIPSDTLDLTNGAGYITEYTETDPEFTAWDKSTGISITESQISDLGTYLTSESDPAFTAWDKSTGISITESQISDLQSYLTAETDPQFTAWDKSTGIVITESQISDLQNYLTAETDPAFTASAAAGIVANDITNWNAAHTHAGTAHAPSNAEANVQPDWNQDDTGVDDYIKNKPTIPTKTSDLTNDSDFATETYVNNKVSTVYKPKGSVLFSSLVVGLLVPANSGFVYNITDAFTTNENFVEGAGKSHSAGTNVVIIENSGNYKFDVLSGTVDLTPYQLLSNKVSSWSETTNNTRYPSEKLVKDSLNSLEQTIQDVSPLRFAGYFTGGTGFNDFNNLIRPFENLTNPLPDFYINNVKGAMFVCNAASEFDFHTVYYWSTEGKTTPITFNWAAPYDQGIGTTNFEVGDTISILNFAYDTVENEMRILIKVEKNPKETFVVKNDAITGATKPKITYDAKGLVTGGSDLTADDIPTHQHTKSEITDFPTIPANKSYSKTITTANWTDKKYAVTISGLEVSDTVLLSGADDIFTTNGLTATITANTLTFEVETLPTVSIDVNFTVIKTEGGTL